MLIVRHLGIQDYESVWLDMKRFTTERNDKTPDEVWILEHSPVYTQGQAGKAAHILRANHIPLIQSDRGGQVTYHGPGQLIAYLLINIQRKNLGVRTFVKDIEKLLITLLAEYHIQAESLPNAPGVYVKGKKIASIGLRVKQGCTYHGIALNVKMDLSPFNDINPCGFSELKMTQMSNYINEISLSAVSDKLGEAFIQYFGI